MDMDFYVQKLPQLRETVRVSQIENGIQLTDIKTGFAVELDETYMQEVNNCARYR
jgi:hypothetical protein